MAQELANVIMPAITTVAQLLIFFYLYRDNRESFLWWWNLAWLCYAVRWGCTVLAVGTQEPSLWLLLRDLSGGLGAFCLCASGCALRWGFTLRATYGIGLCLYGGLIVLGTAFPHTWGPVLIIVPLTVGAGYIVSGLLFFSHRPSRPVKGTKLLAGAHMFWGLLWVGRPFAFQSFMLGQGFIAAGALAHQVAVIGMIILVLEYSKQCAIELRSRLEQAERLATLGELSAGVAHEIRNPLGAIVNAVYALSTENGEFSLEEKRTLLGVVKQEVARLNRLLTDFVRFAKPPEPQRVAGNINVLLAEVAALLRQDTGTAADITIREELTSPTPVTLFDADQLRQAVWNIAKNGVESMAAGQELLITSQVRHDEVLIRIQDSGGGIKAEEVPNIFRPFYSRKTEGIGLGLAIAARIVQAHEGTIEVQSQLGTGTAFVIHLPLMKGVLPNGVHSCR